MGDLTYFEEDGCVGYNDLPMIVKYTGVTGEISSMGRVEVKMGNDNDGYALVGYIDTPTGIIEQYPPDYMPFSLDIGGLSNIKKIMFCGETSNVAIRNIKVFYTYLGDQPYCRKYQSMETCEDNDCYWYNGKCNSDPKQQMTEEQSPPPQERCSYWETEPECVAHGCYWYDGSCHNDPQHKKYQNPLSFGVENKDLWLF